MTTEQQREYIDKLTADLCELDRLRQRDAAIRKVVRVYQVAASIRRVDHRQAASNIFDSARMAMIDTLLQLYPQEDQPCQK